MEYRPTWIIGAGLAGSLLATLLTKRGISVSVSEKRSSVELEQLAAGRSINLALAERGRYALECAGLLSSDSSERIVDAVLAQAIAMPGRQVHMPDGSENFQPYAANGDQSIWSVHRARLNRTLLSAAKGNGATLHFDERLVSVDLPQKTAMIERNGEMVPIRYDLILGADGAGSVLRDAIAARQDELSPKPYVDFLDHGYKEITIAAAADGGFALEPKALHIWPRERFMLIALPNPDKTFTATLFLQNEGALSFAALDSESAIENFFTRYFPDVIALVPDYIAQMQTHPKGLLGTLHCPVWQHLDSAILLGDAAHAIVPFHGQGMNCAFEDCLELAEALTSARPRAQALQQFAARRQPQAKAIAEMALENYVEMRDHVADDDFRLRKSLEQSLARAFPQHFVPRYELVSFSRYSYAKAQARGRWQSALLHEFCDGKSTLAEIDFDAACARVRAELPSLEQDSL